MPRRSRYVSLLGSLLVASAIGHALLQVSAGRALFEAGLELVLVGLSGGILLYIGSWLHDSDINPAFYSRIARWTIAGIGVMVCFLLVRALHPGVADPFSYETRAIALAVGTVAGLSIGIHDARALTRERELRQRNAELERTKEDLRRHNTELTATRAELERTVQQVADSNERLEQFAYVASHDLREPLRMVSSYLQLIERRYGQDFDADGEEFLAYAVDGADRMRTMIDGLLEYSRVETQGDSFEPVALNAILADVQQDLQVKIEERNAEVSVGDLPLVTGDTGQLRQVFQNLVDNAIQYCDGVPRIRIEADSADGDRWVVSVRDNGIGIDPDDAERIFNMFDRLHAADERDGTGIGLALCRRIVERHGGEIWVDSDPGAGATFSLTLPAVATERRVPPGLTD